MGNQQKLLKPVRLAAQLDDAEAEPVHRSVGGRGRRSFTIGDADDAAERRADRFADGALAAASSGRGVAELIDRVPTGPGARIRRSVRPDSIGPRGGDLDDSMSAELNQELGGGQPFESSVRARIEPALGHDLGDVRVHTGARADMLAQHMGAEAFTVRRNVFFARGGYRPDTPDGMHTLLHESHHLKEDGGRVQRSGIRRKLSVTAKDITKVRSKKSRFGSAVGASKSNLDLLAKCVKEYEKAKSPDRQLQLLQHIKDICEAYLDVPDVGGAKRAVVEDLHAEAFADIGKLKAQNVYLEAAYGTPDANNPATTGFWNQSDTKAGGVYKVHEGAKTLGKGQAKANAPGGTGGFDDAALAEVRKSGLTEAEVLAIRTYTAGDYSYMNAAMVSYQQANDNSPKEAKTLDESNAGWWQYELGKKQGHGKDQLRAEGALHAGVAMQGLAKLPKVQATTYRGMDYPAKLVGIDLKKGAKIKWSSFTSTTVKEGTAKQFARGTNATVLEIKTIDGRDLRRLSVFGATEGEVLLLPGAEFTVESVAQTNTYTHVKMQQTK